MAVNIEDIKTASAMNTLKTQLKAELLRRGGEGSV